MRNRMQENRKYVRWPLCGRVRLKLQNGPEPQTLARPALLKDLSFAGAKIAMADSLYLNARLDLEIEMRQEENPMRCQAKLVWQASAGEGQDMPFLCGVSFTNLKDSDKERIFQSVHLFASDNLRHKWWDGIK